MKTENVKVGMVVKIKSLGYTEKAYKVVSGMYGVGDKAIVKTVRGDHVELDDWFSYHVADLKKTKNKSKTKVEEK